MYSVCDFLCAYIYVESSRRVQGELRQVGQTKIAMLYVKLHYHLRLLIGAIASLRQRSSFEFVEDIQYIEQ